MIPIPRSPQWTRCSFLVSGC